MTLILKSAVQLRRPGAPFAIRTGMGIERVPGRFSRSMSVSVVPSRRLPLELVDVESCARGVRDGYIADVGERRRVLAVVTDVGEEEGGEVDLPLDGQHQQRGRLDAAAIGDDPHRAVTWLVSGQVEGGLWARIRRVVVVGSGGA